MGHFVPYDKEGRIWVQEATKQPPPTTSQPNSENIQSNIPTLNESPTKSDPETSFVCRHCKKAFNDEDKLQLHIKRTHKSFEK